GFLGFLFLLRGDGIDQPRIGTDRLWAVILGRTQPRPLYAEVWRNQRVVRSEQDVQSIALLDGHQCRTLLVQNVEAYRRRCRHGDLGAASADALLFEGPQQVEGG